MSYAEDMMGWTSRGPIASSLRGSFSARKRSALNSAFYPAFTAAWIKSSALCISGYTLKKYLLPLAQRDSS